MQLSDKLPSEWDLYFDVKTYADLLREWNYLKVDIEQKGADLRAMESLAKSRGIELK